MTPEWNELKQYVRSTNSAAITSGAAMKQEILLAMQSIECRTLPERVAEILEKADYAKVDQWHSAKYHTRVVGSWLVTLIPAIAQALRSGDTTEIEKWVKK